MTTDQSIVSRVDGLLEEEHRLRGQPAGLTDSDRQRMREVEEELDQCWDLLRQRRARRDVDEDPDTADVRPVDTVENYES